MPSCLCSPRNGDILAVGTFDLCAFDEKLGSDPVGLDQFGLAQPFQVAHGLVNARIVQPGLTALVQVNALQCLVQPTGEQHLAEILPLGEVGDTSVARQIVPAHRLELLDKGQLDLDVLRRQFRHERTP